MIYRNYCKKKNLLENLLASLDLIETKTSIVPISFHPDFEISPYNRDNDKEYYFTSFFKFNENHNFVIDCSFDNQFVFTYEILCDIEENEDYVFSNKENITQSLNELDDNDYNLLQEYQFETKFDTFELNSLKLKTIDNTKKEIHYEGGVFTASMHMDEEFLFSYFTVKAIKYNSTCFYKDLLGESYILMIEENNKLSYFLLYSALESYVNYKLQTQKEDKLKNKIAELFKIEKKVEDLSKNVIYSNVFTEFKTFTNNRNTIAHGKNNISITSSDLGKSFIAVLTFIVSIEFDCNNFVEIIGKI